MIYKDSKVICKQFTLVQNTEAKYSIIDDDVDDFDGVDL